MKELGIFIPHHDISNSAPLLLVYMMQFQKAFILKLDDFSEVKLWSGEGSEFLKGVKVQNHLRTFSGQFL